MPGVPPARYAYLGPEGTFCEEALRSLPAGHQVDPLPCVSVADALDAVRRGEAGGAVVPLENSIEGSVAETLDELAGGDPLQIVREVLLEVSFALMVRPGPPPPPTGADRTTAMAFIADDHPGALLELLTEFAVRGVNLTRIESRPTGVGLGRYYFSIDAEGHVAQARVAEALAAIRRECADVRFLGSYPRADGVAPTERSGTSDLDFSDAHAWVESIRRGDLPG